MSANRIDQPVVLPALMFRHHDPLLITADGESVAKNIVRITHTGGLRRLEPEDAASRTASGA